MKNMIWNRGETIGRGGFGLVSIANVHKQDFGDQFPQVIAVKTAKVSASDSLIKEKNLLDLFNGCPSILHCFGDEVTTEEGEELYNVLLEYAAGGCLADRTMDKGLPENIVRQNTKSMLIALSHVHKLGYVHCDVKPHNVLLVADPLRSRNEIAKLADFGSAKKIKDDDDIDKEFRGTVLYAAPESIIHQEYGPESDIWALGCTVLHMITGKSPWKVEKKDKAEDVLFKIGCSEELPKIPSKISKEGKDFLKKCLIKNPKARWTADMLLSHPFVADFHHHQQHYSGFSKLFRGCLSMHQYFHLHNRVHVSRVQV